ncbi:MAG: CAP domain-containing protein [Acutalibacteraceae bacterium]
MFSKKHISFLIICLILALSLAGCRDKEDHSSSLVVPGGEDLTHSDVSSADTSSDAVSSEPTQSSQASSVTSSKPVNPSVSSTASHLHSFKITRVAPTCTEDGYTFYQCVECGETKIEDYISKKGHSWSEWKTVTEPTTVSTGLKERICTVCGEKETEVIVMLAPDYSALQKELFNLVNNERAKNSLDKLEYNSEMQTKADARAQEIIENFVVKQDENYSENIYKSDVIPDGGLTAKDVFEFWLNSEEFNKNILYEKFTHTVIGVTVKDGKYYWVQIFIG